LTDTIDFHWLLLGEVLDVVIVYKGDGWIGLGFSESGEMIPAKVVIGQKKGVELFNLSQRGVNGVLPAGTTVIAGIYQQLLNSSGVIFNLNMKKGLEGLRNYKEGNLYKMIVAVGSSPVLGYHAERLNFRIDLNACSLHMPI
jgi:hypothetical protein